MPNPSKAKKGSLVPPPPSNDHCGVTMPNLSKPRKGVTMPNPSKARKGVTMPNPSKARKSWAWEEREIRESQMKNLSLGSDSSAPPGGTKEPLVAPGTGTPIKKVSCQDRDPRYITSYTKVDPENKTFCYPLVTTQLVASEEEDIPRSSNFSSKQVKEEEEEEAGTHYVEFVDFCSKCGANHHPGSHCPACNICYDPQHTSAYCPYLRSFPKGANFDRVNYQVVCGCGNFFSEEKWVCIICDGRPKLRRKFCGICCERYVQHTSIECPKDKERAAQLKAKLDKDLARQKKTYAAYIAERDRAFSREKKPILAE